MHAKFHYLSPTPPQFLAPISLAITRYLARHSMSTLHAVVHYSAPQYIASYSLDFAMCILMGTLPPLFPMTFFFSYGVNSYQARPSNFTIRNPLFIPSARLSCLFAVTYFKEHWTPPPLSRYGRYPPYPVTSSCFPIGYNVSTLAPMVRIHQPYIF